MKRVARAIRHRGKLLDAARAEIHFPFEAFSQETAKPSIAATFFDSKSLKHLKKQALFQQGSEVGGEKKRVKGKQKRRQNETILIQV